MSQFVRPPNAPLLAVVSDIHANIDALEAVLADIESHRADAVLCLGDVVGYGPEPAACVEAIRDRCAATVMGNHEAMFLYCAHGPEEELGKILGKPLALAHDQLTPEQKEWIEYLPLVAEMELLQLVHASLDDPHEFHYILSHDRADEHFLAQKAAISFHGHSHVPCIWERGEGGTLCFEPPDKPVQLDPSRLCTVNVGSVGQPRDDDPRASYVLYDAALHSVFHRRVAYDIAKAQDRFRKARLPASNARRLSAGR